MATGPHRGFHVPEKPVTLPCVFFIRKDARLPVMRSRCCSRRALERREVYIQIYHECINLVASDDHNVLQIPLSPSSFEGEKIPFICFWTRQASAKRSSRYQPPQPSRQENAEAGQLT